MKIKYTILSVLITAALFAFSTSSTIDKFTSDLVTSAAYGSASMSTCDSILSFSIVDGPSFHEKKSRFPQWLHKVTNRISVRTEDSKIYVAINGRVYDADIDMTENNMIKSVKLK